MSEQPTTAAGRADAIRQLRGWFDVLYDREIVSEEVDLHRLLDRAIEAEARQQDDSALRAALHEAFDAERATSGGNEWNANSQAFIIDRALAALPPSAPAVLDVGLLARALHDSTWACPTGQVVSNWCDPRRGELFHVSQAESIAAEYAQLQEPDR